MNHPGSKHHADHHGHDKHSHEQGGHAAHPPGWQKHSKWFVLAVVLMLVGMFVYVVTLDEEVQPEGAPGEGERMPAAEAP